MADECKLTIGTNLSAPVDWGTEIAFVDLMKSCRTWYTKSQGDPNDPFDTGLADQLSYRPDGYPTHIPQTVPGASYPQQVATYWASTDAWPGGDYVVLFDGTGTLDFWGAFDSFSLTNPGRYVIHFPHTAGGELELRIVSSDTNDPVHNIRVLMPGTEDTYPTQPFYSLWLEKLAPFKVVRFMDWGHTNNWGQVDEYTTGPYSFVDWTDRSQPDYYTWTHAKGVPYEMMVKLMNDYDKDGWVCVPHTAGENYVRNMADFFRDNLEPGRHLYVEYSNEIWNWLFGQTDWLYQYGCVQQGVDWPEGIVPYIQNVMNYWTGEYAGQLDRITRVVGVQTGWLDVSQRIVTNLAPNSFDAIAPTYYFGLGEDDSALDALGASATVADIDYYTRQYMPTEYNDIAAIVNLADSLNKKIVFYEGGQHITPIPFGEPATYEQALLDIQRDPLMYDLYNDWYDSIRTFQAGDQPLLLMNYAFIGPRDAQNGSWGILETMDQDTSVIPAPKYASTIQNMDTGCMILPVTWPGPLTAAKAGDKVLLTWTVAHQRHNEQFIIEHSPDGMDFRPAGTLSAAGDQPAEMRYHFLHTSPVTGTNYYRIKQVDQDGRFEYSNIASVLFDQARLILYPNPVRKHLTVSTPRFFHPTALEIRDLTGQLVQRAPLRSGTAVQTIDVSVLPPGTYFVNDTNSKFGPVCIVIIP